MIYNSDSMAEKRNTQLCRYGVRCRRPNCRYVHPDRMEVRSNTVNCKSRQENSCFVHLDGKNPPPHYDFNPTQKSSTEHMSESNTLHDSGVLSAC